MLDREGVPLVACREGARIHLLPAMANRHGLVTGATGTGKTVTLQTLAESLSALGVPVFVTDVKGDVAGVARPGGGNAKIDERVQTLGLAAEGYAPRESPTCCWDLFGRDGHPLRATLSEMGPLLLGRLLRLNDTRQGVLHILFRIADADGLLLLDLKDMRALIDHVRERRADYAGQGHIAPASLGAIQRGLLELEDQGAESFFGEPALDVQDLMRREDGRGVVNLLSATRLMQSPRVYAAFLLWLLSELHETLPEAGDLAQPKLVLFFDEAHLLFADAPRVLVEKVEQVARLIRSKGVGVFFVTQNPADIPETILAQLGNRVQHALRAYTPGERKAVRAAADAFRPNPAFKTEEAIGQLGVGEALVSFLDAKGVPGVVERAWIVPPEGRVGPLSDDERAAVVRGSALYGRYERAVDRESAYEILARRADAKAAGADASAPEPSARGAKGRKDGSFAGELVADVARKTGQSVSRNIANTIGRALVRGVLGGLFGGRK